MFIIFSSCQIKSSQHLPFRVRELTFKSQKRYFTHHIKKCYELYFGCKLGDKVKRWVPHICCVTCVRLLTRWGNGSRQIPLAVPIVWGETNDLSFDCYVCLTNIVGITSKSKYTVKCPDLPSAMGPVPNGEELPVSKPSIRLLAMTSLIQKTNTNSKKGTMLIAMRHSKQVVPHLNPIF